MKVLLLIDDSITAEVVSYYLQREKFETRIVKEFRTALTHLLGLMKQGWAAPR